jgi:cell division initiation protein
VSLSPLAIRNTRFPRRLRGYDPREVEDFLEVVGEELTRALTEIDRLRQRVAHLQERLELGEARERELQETLLRAQKVSEEMMTHARREAQVLVKEGEVTADRIVHQAIEQAQHVERGIAELRQRRQELRLKLQATLEIFHSALEADAAAEQESPRGTVHPLPRRRQESSG